MMRTALAALLDRHIQKVPDFPKKGILFYDISPLFLKPDIREQALAEMAVFIRNTQVEGLVAPEARGFLLAAPLAAQLSLPLIIMRKPGKLPRKVFSLNYDLEYCSEGVLEVHQDAVYPGQKLMIVDDVLATAGTVQAMAQLIQKGGGVLSGYSFLMELLYLEGRQRLEKGLPVQAVLQYDR